MADLEGFQRKYLRGQAHGLKPVVHVGKNGFSDALAEEVDQALSSHELIKIKFVESKDDKAAIVAALEERLDCTAAGIVGHTAILFRQNRVPEERKIRLPRR